MNAGGDDGFGFGMMITMMSRIRHLNHRHSRIKMMSRIRHLNHRHRTMCTAINAIGGSVPVSVEEMASRASLAVLRPQRNPIRDVMKKFDRTEQIPPLLGIFNDIPWHQIRESDVASWAKAGFTWIVNDGEHSGPSGRMTREINAMFIRYGITPVQRLHREAISEHGDSLAMGSRATMRPYGIELEETQRYLRSVEFPPVEGNKKATRDDRGAFPMRHADRTMTFTPQSLRDFETETQGWLQFETSEYIVDKINRDRVLDEMASRGAYRTALFVGPFDAIVRGSDPASMEKSIAELFQAASARGIVSGRVCGSGTCEEPDQIESAMVKAIHDGARLISLHYLTSDLTYIGARAAAEPFFRACASCGF